MSLDKIKEKIISSSQKQAEEIINKAKSDIENELNNFENSLRKEFASKFEEEKKLIDDEIVKLRISHNLKVEKEINLLKNKIIEKFFSVLKEKILSDENLYLSLITRLIEKDAPNNSVVYINEKDFNLFGKKIKSFIDERLKDKNVKLSKTTVEISGGCIIKTENYEVNDSIDEIINTFKERKDIEVAREIFSNE
ncbi:MAG: V-type ATP synthase subunit E [Caldisericaceae bacterium]